MLPALRVPSICLYIPNLISPGLTSVMNFNPHLPARHHYLHIKLLMFNTEHSVFFYYLFFHPYKNGTLYSKFLDLKHLSVIFNPTSLCPTSQD